MSATRRRIWRTPKTMREKRAYGLAILEGVTPRPRRNPVNIPDNWDDIHFSRERMKSWKEKRERQAKL